MEYVIRYDEVIGKWYLLCRREGDQTEVAKIYAYDLNHIHDLFQVIQGSGVCYPAQDEDGYEKAS